MEESSVSGQIKVEHVVYNPCRLVQQAVRAILKCFDFHESGNQSHQEDKSSNYSLQEDEERNHTSPVNETPVVEEMIRVTRRVPPPPVSRGRGGQIN